MRLVKQISLMLLLLDDVALTSPSPFRGTFFQPYHMLKRHDLFACASFIENKLYEVKICRTVLLEAPGR